MNVNPMYELVARHQHEQDMRHAAEFHQVQEARRRNAHQSVLARLFDRLKRGDRSVVELAPESKPRAAV